MISCFHQSSCHRSQIVFSTYNVEKHLWCHSKPNYFQKGIEMVPRSLFHVFLCHGWSPLVSRSSYYHEQFLPSKSSDSWQPLMGSMSCYNLCFVSAGAASARGLGMRLSQLLATDFWWKICASADSCLSQPQAHKTNPLTLSILWIFIHSDEDQGFIPRWLQTVKDLPAMQETWVQSLGWGDPLEKGIATHSSILAWKIPWTEEPGGLTV